MTSEERKQQQKQIKNTIFNTRIHKSVKSRAEDREALSRQLERDTEAFIARGGRVKRLPSHQSPPNKRPAMQHYGNGGFYQA